MSNSIAKIQPNHGPLFDRLFILDFDYLSVTISLFFGAGDKSVKETAVEQEQFGYDEQVATENINDKFDYTIDSLMLSIIALEVRQ